MMRDTLVLLGVEIRDSKFKQFHNINRNFFKVINTEQQAYWLGFLYADGYILRAKSSIEGFGCTLTETDISHLEKLKLDMNSTPPIQFRFKNSSNENNEHKQYISEALGRLDIRIKEIGLDLCNLGCIPTKSLILKYPTIKQVPLNLQHHFIRGYFDGDGCLSYHNTKKKYSSIEILGTYDFLLGVQNFLNITPSYIDKPKDGNIFRYRIYAKDSILEFYNKIYRNSTLFLDRKFKRFQDFLQLNNFL